MECTWAMLVVACLTVTCHLSLHLSEDGDDLHLWLRLIAYVHIRSSLNWVYPNIHTSLLSLRLFWNLTTFLSLHISNSMLQKPLL